MQKILTVDIKASHQLPVKEIHCDACIFGQLPSGSVVKKPSANAGDAGDVDLIPGSERSTEKKMATHSSILACKIPWTDEPGGLQSTGQKESGKTEHSL